MKGLRSMLFHAEDISERRLSYCTWACCLLTLVFFIVPTCMIFQDKPQALYIVLFYLVAMIASCGTMCASSSHLGAKPLYRLSLVFCLFTVIFIVAAIFTVLSPMPDAIIILVFLLFSSVTSCGTMLAATSYFAIMVDKKRSLNQDELGSLVKFRATDL